MKYLVFLTFLAILGACTPNVVFVEPQPRDSKDLTEFPNEFRGMYMAVDDSSLYQIKSDMILEKWEEDLASDIAELAEDKNIELIGDTLLLLDINQRFPVSHRNDSVFGWIEIYDTVFSFSRGDRLRKLKKDYFLNIHGDSLWMVFKLNIDHWGNAYLCEINQEREMEIFQRYSRVEIQTNEDDKPEKYILSPTKKELRKLLNMETFTDTSVYIRISQDLPR